MHERLQKKAKDIKGFPIKRKFDQIMEKIQISENCKNKQQILSEPWKKTRLLPTEYNFHQRIAGKTLVSAKGRIKSKSFVK